MESTGRKRHCWECVRRCLVCDGNQPTCKRCSKAGTSCPGYSGSKPPRLRWLPPGKIISRANKRSKPQSSSRAPTMHDQQLAVSSPIDLSLSNFEMTSESDVFFEAIRYFNTCIHEDLIPVHQLGNNPHIYPLSPAHVQKAPIQPEYVGLSVLCMTLSHRINRVRAHENPKPIVQRFYHYRGNVILSLSRAIDAPHNVLEDALLAGILLLLLVDVQQGTTSTWRCHLEAIQRLIHVRGGLSVLEASWGLRPLLRSFVMLSVFGNTTCPVKQMSMTEWHLQEAQFIIERQSQAPTPFQLCPPALFADIISINMLRTQKPLDQAHAVRELLAILERIQSFLPLLWARSRTMGHEHWELAGQTYQAATVLYCISSLQSAFLLPRDAILGVHGAEHAESLQTLLTGALSNPRIKRFMLWPLVVLGVEAAVRSPTTRRFVTESLVELSYHVGSYAPIEAKLVLERFWASGDTDWDSCFDRPYAFITQSAVDLAGISPSSTSQLS